MKTETLKKRLPLDFTGIIITCLPDSEQIQRFLLFKEGRVELGLWYGGEQMPSVIEEWINQNGFAGLKVFKDDHHIISQRDFEKLTDEGERKLTLYMDCVEIQY